MDLDDIAGYSLRRKLGSGSAGTVWQVRDLVSGRNVVLKRVPVTAISDPEEFREQLIILQRIDHPHLARLVEFRETETDWLLFSQYVVAGTLSSLLSRRGPLSTGELVTLLSPLAEALDHLHRSGLTHGRVTPRNVMFDSAGRPVLTDPVIHLQITLATDAPTPADDLTSLTHLAHESGGNPALFPPTLFTARGSRDLLTLATPAPIDLAFPEVPSSPSTDSDADADAPDSSHSRPSASTTPPITGDPVPPIPTPTDRPVSRRSKLTRRTTTAASPLDRLTPRQSISDAYVASPPIPSSNLSGLPPPGRRRSRRRVWRGKGVFRRRSFRRPAYGVLAAVGLGAVVVLILGLLTVGALDNQPTPTAVTDPAASPSPQTPASAKPQTASPTRRSTPSPSPTRSEAQEWLRTLQALDVQRAQAFWAVEPSILDRIYVPGSEPWTSDRALMLAYRKQRLRVEGLRIRIDTTTVERRTSTTVTLRTVDHLIAGRLVDRRGIKTPLPPAMPTTRLITLTTSPGTPTWRIATITNA